MLIDDQIEISQIKYKVYGEIGAGTCGTVYVVQCPQKKKYALKVINQYGRDQRMKYLIDKEIATQSTFNQNHNIIHIYGHMQRYKKMYILLELGEFSLRNRIELNSHIVLREFLKICVHTSRALYSIHSKNFTHKDIKPENIICVEGNYKITDFGSSDGQTVGADDVLGTTLYMAPELLKNQVYSKGVDVWSLGVSLFEAYFHIHPFFYLEGDEHNERTVEEHLKGNMKYLLPDFSMQKFLILINKKVSQQKAKHVNAILKVTPAELLRQFPLFFQPKSVRPSIEYFLGAFLSLIETVQQRQPKQVKLNTQLTQIPSDIRFYLDTLNLFYQLNSQYASQMFNQVELKLELAVFYWSNVTYRKFKFIQYYQESKFKQNLTSRVILWRQIKNFLLDYWLELSSNQLLGFFSQLNVLKIRILICGARFDLLTSSEQQILFYSKIHAITNMQIDSLQQLEQHFPVFQARQFQKIEEYLNSRYYYR